MRQHLGRRRRGEVSVGVLLTRSTGMSVALVRSGWGSRQAGVGTVCHVGRGGRGSYRAACRWRRSDWSCHEGRHGGRHGGGQRCGSGGRQGRRQCRAGWSAERGCVVLSGRWAWAGVGRSVVCTGQRWVGLSGGRLGPVAGGRHGRSREQAGIVSSCGQACGASSNGGVAGRPGVSPSHQQARRVSSTLAPGMATPPGTGKDRTGGAPPV